MKGTGSGPRRAFFRAVPVEQTLRIAIREALRRLPSDGGPKGIPVFKDDATDTYGGALGFDPSPIVSEADLIHLGVTNPEAEKPPQAKLSEFKLGPRFSGDPTGASKLDCSEFTQAARAAQRVASKR